MTPHFGEVAEWLNAPVSKTGLPARVAGVRISPSPLNTGMDAVILTLVPQRDSERLRGADQAAVRADGFEPSDSVADLDRGDLRPLPRDHLAEIAGVDQFDRVRAEHRAEHAIERRR